MARRISGHISFDVPDDAPVYVISVAAQLSGLHPQTLRQYDRLGLVCPGRTGGGGRRYSLRDIQQLREVQRLTALGIGLEGVKRILELENDVEALHAEIAELRAQLAEAQAKFSASDYRRTYLPAPVDASTTVVVWRPH